MSMPSILLLLVASLCHSTAFLSPQSHLCPAQSRAHQRDITSPSRTHHPSTHKVVTPRRQKDTALPSLFGLGPGELAIIALAGLLVIGPTKLSEMSREAGKVAGKTGNELKDGAKSIKDAGVPEEWKAIGDEFKKGVEEGEIEARGRKAKVMDSVEED